MPPGYTGQCQYGKGTELNTTRSTPSLYWNEEARMRWLHPANIRTAIIHGQLTTVLVDSRARMNVVMLEFVKARGLAAGSIQDLNNHAGCIPINGVGGKHTEPLGYIMIRVQIPYAPSYGEDQVAFIVEDPFFILPKMSCDTRNSDHIPGSPGNEGVRDGPCRAGLATCESRI